MDETLGQVAAVVDFRRSRRGVYGEKVKRTTHRVRDARLVDHSLTQGALLSRPPGVWRVRDKLSAVDLYDSKKMCCFSFLYV